MTDGKSELDLPTAITSLNEALPARAEFLTGALNSTSKKLKALAKATSTAPANVKNPTGTYTFDQPAFIHKVFLFGPDIGALRSSLTVTTVGIDDKRKNYRLDESGKGTANHLAFFKANQIIKSIEIFVSEDQKVIVSRISLSGYRFDEIEEIGERLSQALDLRRDIDKYTEKWSSRVAQAQTDLDNIQRKISDASGKKDKLEEDISGLEVKKNDAESLLSTLMSTHADAQTTLHVLEEKVTSKQNNEIQLQNEVKSLNESIGRLKRELKELENDRSIISDEYRDYVKEGRGQATLYSWIAAVCLLASLIGAGLLVKGAEYYLDPRVTSVPEAYALFVQRLPFTAAFAATIGLFLKLADYLIKAVYSIHQSRLTLARLLVLAKDTVYSSASDLDVSDADRLRERVKLKVDLLRQYLSTELGAKAQTTEKPGTEEPVAIGHDQQP